MDLNPNDEAALRQGRAFVWHELYVPNTDEAVEFYKQLGFGTATMDMGPHGPYTMLTRDGKPVCGMQSTRQAGMEDVPPHWSVYLGVDDVDASVAAATAAGAKVVVPAMSIPTVGRMSLIADPQGAFIWLFAGER